MNENPNLPDPRPLFLTALDQVTPLIGEVTPTDLDRPTPCHDWAVRDLLSHLIGVAKRIPHVAAGGRADEVPDKVGGVPDDGWTQAWHDHVGHLRDAVADDNALGAIVNHPAGQMPWAMAIGIYASELAVHAWDLARAIGRDEQLDQQVAAGVVGPMRGALPPEPRGADIGIPFGPVVEVADDAPPYAQLVAWVGRDPEWTAGRHPGFAPGSRRPPG